MEENKETPNANTAAAEQPTVTPEQPATVDAGKEKKPFYKKGWFWGTVGAVAVGGTVAYFCCRKGKAKETAEVAAAVAPEASEAIVSGLASFI
jgi:hypothetical protein